LLLLCVGATSSDVGGKYLSPGRVVGVAGGRPDRRRRRPQCRTPAPVVLGGAGHDAAAGDREGPSDPAATSAGATCTQVSATRAAAAAAAQQRRPDRHTAAAATSLHAAQLCQHEERPQAHDHLQGGQELHW